MLGMGLENCDPTKLIEYLSVKAIYPDHVVYSTKSPDGETIEHEVPTNFVLWSTGIAMNPFTHRVSTLLPNQVHKKAIEVDAHLRVKGAPLGDVYAIGDCATVSAVA
jgi:NADH dehydrogenase FAD-containing subunit